MSGGILMKGFRMQNWIAPGAVAATSTAAPAATVKTLGLGDCYALGLEVTAASGTSPTCDVVLQTSLDNGTTWKDLPIRWTQKTTTSAGVPEWIVFRLGLGQNEVALAQVTADTGGQLAKNCLFDPDQLRVKFTIGGTNPSFTFLVHAMTLPVQRVA